MAEARRFSAVGVASTLYGMARVGFYSRDAFAALSARLMDLLPMLTPQVGRPLRRIVGHAFECRFPHM